jgi:hypothetical protein
VESVRENMNGETIVPLVLLGGGMFPIVLCVVQSYNPVDIADFVTDIQI